MIDIFLLLLNDGVLGLVRILFVVICLFFKLEILCVNIVEVMVCVGLFICNVFIVV